jgi:hypothetical protein
LALAAVATVGAWLVTVTVLVPMTPLLVAVTEPVAELFDAVNSPVLPIVPTPSVSDQVTVGVKFTPNCSTAEAVNCSVAAALMFGFAGLTVIEVAVWLTVTLMLLVAVNPPASVIVAVKTYIPACVNVAVVLFASFVPVALRVTLAGPATAQA